MAKKWPDEVSDDSTRYDYPHMWVSKRLEPGKYVIFTTYGSMYVVERTYDIEESVSPMDRPRLTNWRRQVWRLWDLSGTEPELLGTAINKEDLIEDGTIFDLDDAHAPRKPTPTYGLDDLASLVTPKEDDLA